jgi:FkbM family methyltransferase
MLIDFNYIKDKYNLNITGVVHVGAHYGEEIPSYLEQDIKKIVCFEPLIENLEVLIQYRSDIVKVFPYALGETEDTVTMYRSTNNLESSSILKPKMHLELYQGIKFNSTSEVKMKKLSSFKKSINGCNFLNMDVQGYEFQVLLGAEECISQFDYIYAEVNRDETYENNVLVDKIDEYLGARGLIRVETDWSGVIWGDAFYIKKELLNDNIS